MEKSRIRKDEQLSVVRLLFLNLEWFYSPGLLVDGRVFYKILEKSQRSERTIFAFLFC
jgi:hypothetical protein